MLGLLPSVVNRMVTGIEIPDAIHVVLQGAPQNVIVGLVGAAPIGEEIASRRSRGTRMMHHLRLAKGGVTKTAGPMPEKLHHHLGILINTIN